MHYNICTLRYDVHSMFYHQKETSLYALCYTNQLYIYDMLKQTPRVVNLSKFNNRHTVGQYYSFCALQPYSANILIASTLRIHLFDPLLSTMLYEINFFDNNNNNMDYGKSIWDIKYDMFGNLYCLSHRGRCISMYDMYTMTRHDILQYKPDQEFAYFCIDSYRNQIIVSDYEQSMLSIYNLYQSVPIHQIQTPGNCSLEVFVHSKTHDIITSDYNSVYIYDARTYKMYDKISISDKRTMYSLCVHDYKNELYMAHQKDNIQKSTKTHIDCFEYKTPVYGL